MKKIVKLTLIICGIALVSKTMDKMKEEETKVPNLDFPKADNVTIIWGTTVAHTNENEQRYGLAKWDWSYADIYMYNNNMMNVQYHDRSHDGVVESAWLPYDWYGGA